MTERGVKMVTEAAVSVCGGEARDGFIVARQQSRKANQLCFKKCYVNQSSEN